MSLDDRALTEQGFDERDGGNVLLLACGALAREILALKRLNGWDHMHLTCLPAKLHNRPERIPDAVEEAVLKHRADYEEIFVVYADCGTGGLLQARCKELGVKMIEGPHCYAFYDTNDGFAARAEDEITAFYLTDFIARQFEALIWRGLKLDKHPELRDMYFGNYTKVIYLAQTENPELDLKAQAAAERLGLAYERRFTGYGELETVLAKV